MAEMNVNEVTATRHLDLVAEIRSLIQDFVSGYERDDDVEDWDSVSACLHAIMQLDMSAQACRQWLEEKAGMREPVQSGWNMERALEAITGNVTPPRQDGDDSDTVVTGGNYL